MRKSFQKGGVRPQVTCGGRWAGWVGKGGVPGALGSVPGGLPARMQSRSWKAVLKRVLLTQLSWASRARKVRQLRKARRPAPTAKLQATLLLLRTQ